METPGYTERFRKLAGTSTVVLLTMPLAFIFLLLNLRFLLQATPTTATEADPKTLNITTIAANAQKESVIECWQLSAPFIASAAAGTSGGLFAQLGETGATSYGLIPAEFDGGLHNAPVIQWVFPCPLTASSAFYSICSACERIWLTPLFSIPGTSPFWLEKRSSPCRTQHKQQQSTVAETGSFLQLTLLMSARLAISLSIQARRKPLQYRYPQQTMRYRLILSYTEGHVGKKSLDL